MSSQPYDPSQQQQIYAYDYQQQHPQPSSYDPYQTQQYYHNQTHPPPPPSSSSSSYPPYYTPAYTSGPNTNCNNNNYGVEDSSIHPPGVPITESNGSISSNDVQNQHNSYYYYYPNAGIADMSINNQPHVQNPQVNLVESF
ncbi:hypothetical protein LIER_37898 [Lithospermum erythrorhizon]|uniref:Uncharacterized protein n=1 Tax=Lithospermum erythrorhizon TaxID=34254 RepID=A0AAV3PRS5_LITER